MRNVILLVLRCKMLNGIPRILRCELPNIIPLITRCNRSQFFEFEMS